MKLFDIQDSKVVIHADMLGLPFFHKLWNSEEDKDLVNRWISYIVLKNKYDSPYVKTYSSKEVESKVKADVFDDKTYIIPEKVLVAEKEFNETIQNSLILKLLMATRKKLDSIREYYENSDSEELDDAKVQKITMSIAKLGDTVKSLRDLEKAVKVEETELERARGGAEINWFEQTRK